MPILHKAKAIRRHLLLCLLLGTIGSTAAFARDVRMHGPNGDGGACPDTTATATPAPAKPATAAATAIHAPDKAKPVIGVHGGGDEGSSHTPRWHSFLPGMFR
jgi:hypothetical protein